MIDRAPALAALVLCACTPGPVHGVVRYQLDGAHLDRGAIVAASDDAAPDPWAPFWERWRATCPRALHGVDLDHVTLQADPAAPLEELFGHDVRLSVYTRSGDATLVRYADLATAEQPHGAGPLELESSWSMAGTVPERSILMLTGAPAPGVERRLPVRLVVTLQVTGHCDGGRR